MSQQQAKPSTPKSQQQGEKSTQKPRQNNVNGNNNNNKQDGNQQQKPFRGTARTARGGSRGGSGGKRRDFSKQNSKTVFVGRIFFDDLYTNNITTSLADKLKDQRIRLLKEVFASFGTVEAIESHFNTDDNSYMLVTYETTEDAKNAYQTMRSKDKVAEEMDKIRGRLSQQKQFPPNVCPELFEYRYDMSDKPANAKSAGKKNLPKTVIAGANPLQAVQQTVTANAQPQEQATQQQPAKNNNKKARKDKKNEEEASEKPAPKKEQKQPPKKQQGSGDLQREAEKAKLKEELKYLQNQQTHVSQEIAAEKSRAKERDERILKLSTELARVREEEQMLQNKLNAENNYRSDAEHRIQKLREELSHMHQEEQLVKQKMSIFEQQEQQQGSQQNGTY